MKKQTTFTIFISCQLALLWQLMLNNLQAASTDPMLLSKWPGYPGTPPNKALTLAGNYVYTLSDDFLVYDVSDPKRPQLAGWCSLNSPWPSMQNLAISGDYAYVTGDKMLKVIDIRDPRQPRQVTQYSTKGITFGITISGNYAYVSGALDYLQIFDIRNPLQIERVSQLSNGSKNLVVSGDYAYVIDSTQGMHVLNIKNPAQPQFLVRWAIPGVKYNLENMVASGSTLYLRYAEDIFVVDVQNPAQPKLVEPGMSMPGFSTGLAIEGRYAYVNSKDDFVVVDVSAANVPAIAGACRIGNGDWTTQAEGIAVRDHYAFVAANGLVVLDISNPAEPRVVGAARNGNTRKLAFDGSYVYAANQGGELQIIDASDSYHPRLIGSFMPQGNIIAMVLKKPYVYLANSLGNLQIVDISSPIAPMLVGECSEIRCQSGLQISGNYAYVGATDGLCVIDVSDPAHPEWVGGLYKGGTPVGVQNSILYSITSLNTLNTIDIQDPLNIKLLSVITLDVTFTYEIAIAGNYVYVPMLDGIEIVDISDPLQMKKAGRYDGPGSLAGNFSPNAVSIQSNRAFVVDQGLLVLDITQPTQPTRITGKDFNVGDQLFGVSVQANRAYLAAGLAGLLVCNLYPQAPRILEPSIRTDAAGRHLIFQGQAGQTLQIQKSPELKNWITWQTVIATGQEQEVLDNTPLATGVQFYRIIAP